MNINSLIKWLTIFILSLSFTVAFSQKIKVGSKAPHFMLVNTKGEMFDSTNYLFKKNLVIFFYTKDESPICEKEILSFNNRLEEIKNLDGFVVGLNPASIIYHRRFCSKFNLNYPILYDRNSATQKMFEVPNVINTKNPQRYTFIVDKKGVIQEIIRGNGADIHITETIKILEILNLYD